jgi:hypothetical protein
MPRKSNRKEALDALRRRVYKLKKNALLRELMDEEDSIQDDYDQCMFALLKKKEKCRYLFRKTKYRKNRQKFNLQDCLSEDSVNYNDEEFLYCFRMTRESFFLLLKEMESKDAFRHGRFKKPRPISFQLLVFLYRVGKQGTCGSSLAVSHHFGIGKGSVNNYVRKCVAALHEIHDDVVHWPDEDQRQEMKNRLAMTGFRHCTGIIDGTLIVLEFKPEKFHECYYSRKSFYALNVMIVCDDRKRITFYLAGWPGSSHDNRVFRNSLLFLNKEDYFNHMDYLLGDSAYSASSIMVQSFKKLPGSIGLGRDEKLFNTLLAQVRIASEHCIGILKGRFGCLKRNNIKLKSGPEEVKELVDLIGACIVMHNLLINYDDDTIPQEWYDEVSNNIDWTLYDEEEEGTTNINDEVADRRDVVFKSIINNFI